MKPFNNGGDEKFYTSFCFTTRYIKDYITLGQPYSSLKDESFRSILNPLKGYM